MNANSVIIGGRLTRDPRMREVPGGESACEASIANNRRFKRDGEWVEEPVFVDVVISGRTGEAFARHHQKGDPVFISGSLRFERWEDIETGASRSKLYVVADEWQLVKANGPTGAGSPSEAGQ